MAYKVLGLVVWRGGKWFLRRRYGRLVPSRGVALAGLGGIAALGVAAVALSRSGQE
jgi:hypothetical protein